MQTAQLACPHCGSMLNFGVEITAGSPVECLICMQTFLAETTVSLAPPPPWLTTNKTGPAKHALQSIDAADTATLSDAVTIPPTTPMPAVPKAKKPPKKMPVSSVDDNAGKETGTTPKVTTAVAAAPRQKPVPASPSSQPCCTGSRIAVAAVAVGGVFLLAGGVGFAVWAMKTRSAEQPQESALASNQEPPIPKPSIMTVPPVEAKSQSKPQPKSPDPLPPIAVDPKNEAQPKPKDGAKGKKDDIVLERKNPLGGASLDPEEVIVPVLNKQNEQAWGVNQQRVNEAIAKGIDCLKKTQAPNGTWMQGHAVGHAALGGLTLLECGVPAKDLAVQRSAVLVRNSALTLENTYEISLSILFLDRLGDPRDRSIIQGLALRLLAGQNDCGGWTYISRLDPKDMYPLYTFLQSNKKPNVFDQLLAQDKKKLKDDLSSGTKKKPGDDLTAKDPFKALSDLITAKEPEHSMPQTPTGQGTPTNPMPDGGVNPGSGNDPKKSDSDKPVTVAKKDAPVKGKKVVPIRPEWLQQHLQALPVVRNQGKGKGKVMVKQGNSDNSNTQFALLALWAARRHDVPVDQALLAGFQRFVNTQCDDGAWGYHPAKHSPTASMTGVGLLGMAMGHGASPEIVGVDPNDPKKIVIKPALDDPMIQTGLKAFSRYIGEPSAQEKVFPLENLYFLWTVERVAMLYDLKTIEGKDWYGWGAQILLYHQRPDGSWPNSNFHGTDPQLNTCFALLFLKRSNLVRDLTKNLRVHTGLSAVDR